jgi:hypothetical protein
MRLNRFAVLKKVSREWAGEAVLKKSSREKVGAGGMDTAKRY